MVVALVALIGVWSVLSMFPATQEVARAFLASSAVLAVIAGLALTTPLGNLGSGVLLAFTQPVRLGDRITVDDHTGIVDEISLSYTALTTDEGRRIFVPNTRMVSTTLVNRSVDDPRRLVTVELPVRLGAPLDDARRIAMEAAARAPAGREPRDLRPGRRASPSGPRGCNVVAYAPFGADVSQVASEIREQAVAALGDGRAAARLEVEALARPRSTRTSTSGAVSFIAAANSTGGRSTKPGFPVSPRWIGKYVPQWIGMTSPRTDARDRLGRALGIEMAAAAEPGPHPQIGMSPTSTGPRSRISSKRSVSPAK